MERGREEEYAMKRVLSALAVSAFLIGALAGPASAAGPHVVATISGGGTSTMAEVFGIPNPGSSVFQFSAKLMSDGSATGHIDCLDQHGDAPGFPGNIFGAVVSWSGDLDGEITLNVVGKFVPLPGGHPEPAAFTVKIQQFGGAGVGHWTLDVDGVVFCIETLDSGRIVLRRM
jgi:hypothetical protein